MEPSDEILRVLTEIRDVQREAIAEYRRARADYDEARKVTQDAIRRQRINLFIFAVLVFILGAIVATEVFLPRQPKPVPPTLVLPNSSVPGRNAPTD